MSEVTEALKDRIEELETELTVIREQRDKEIQTAKNKYKESLKTVTKKLSAAKRMVKTSEKL